MEDSKLIELLTKIQEDLGAIKTDMAVIRVDLNHHIKRSDLAEAGLKQLREDSKADLNQLRKELTPIKKYVLLIEGIPQLLGLITLCGSVVFTIIKFLNIF